MTLNCVLLLLFLNFRIKYTHSHTQTHIQTFLNLLFPGDKVALMIHTSLHEAVLIRHDKVCHGHAFTLPCPQH